MNGVALAYLGDASFELLVRRHLLSLGYTKVKDLHNLAINFTKGENQAKFIEYLINENRLTEEEIKAYKNGRNAHTLNKRKNLSQEVYHKATGFEAVIGYLDMLENEERIKEIFNEMVRWLNEEK